VTCFQLLQAATDSLHQERELLCQRLAAVAAPPSHGSDTEPGVATSSGGGGPSGGAASLCDAASGTGGGAALDTGAPAPCGAAKLPHAEPTAAATGAETAAAPAAAPAAARYDSFTEQSEIADQIAANTARMGGLLQLHFTTLHVIFTDLQRARLVYLSFPFPPNATKCAACLSHMLKFEPGLLPPAAELDLRSEMACWASPCAGPAPQWRWAGIGAAASADGGNAASSGAGPAAGGAACRGGRAWQVAGG
jgi:hypothetical protein